MSNECALRLRDDFIVVKALGKLSDFAKRAGVNLISADWSPGQPLKISLQLELRNER